MKKKTAKTPDGSFHGRNDGQRLCLQDSPAQRMRLLTNRIPGLPDRTITVQAYVDDIEIRFRQISANTETMKKITELTGIKLDVRYTPCDSDSKVLASQLFPERSGCDHLSGQLHKTGVPGCTKP